MGNWDYRYCWIRDAAFTLNALLRPDVHRRLRPTWWLLQATQLTHPRLQPLYRLDGGSSLRSETWPWPATGDRARSGWATLPAQQQLDTYGEPAAVRVALCRVRRRIDAEVGHRLGEVADLVCTLWRQPDAGIWRSAASRCTSPTRR